MPLLNCSDATSLFELGFGANAVLAILGDKVTNARRFFLTKYLDALVSHDKRLDRKRIDRLEIHKILLGGLKNYARLIKLSVLLQGIALFMLGASLITLIQNAVWGSSCKLVNTDLYVYVLFAFILLPLLYFFYAKYLDYTTNVAIAKTVPSATQLSAALVLDLELADRVHELTREQLGLAGAVTAAIEKGTTVAGLDARMNAINKELKAMLPKVEQSKKSVLIAFQNALKSRNDA